MNHVKDGCFYYLLYPQVCKDISVQFGSKFFTYKV